MAAVERQLVVAVEGTAAMGPYWSTIVADYVEKIVRNFCASELPGQRSGWTKDTDAFLSWLSGISFSGGGFSEASTCEGLAEALTILQGSPNTTTQSHQNHEAQKHCILVTASNPYPLPTPVYRLPTQSTDHKENIESSKEPSIADAETVAKSFAQCSVSLSVISPKQVPTLKAIYNAGKRNPRAADPSVDHAKNPHFLVLLSENFMEARTALSRPLHGNMAPNQTITKMDTAPAVTMSGPTSNANSSVNGPMIGRQSVGVGGISTATIKVEPATVPPMVSAPTFSHITPISNVASQGISALQTSSPSHISQEADVANDSVQEHKPIINPVQQPVRPGGHGSLLNNLSQVRLMNSTSLTRGATSMGLPNIGTTPIQVHISNMISSGMTSTPSVISSMSGPGQPIAAQQMVQSTGLGSFGSNTSTVSGNSNVAVSSSLPNIQSSMGMGQSVQPVAQGGLMAGSQLGQGGIGANQNVMGGQGGIGANQNVMGGLGSTAISSAPAMMPTPGMAQQTGVNSLGVTNNSAMNMPIGQHPNGQQAPPKYVKIWEGTLSGQRQGQPVFICKLEGYRSGIASETLLADWPETMQIVRLIVQEHMNNKQYVGKADFLVFRTLNQHGFLGQLQEKKLCAVIQLTSQTLLLSMSDKAGHGGVQTSGINSATTNAAATATATTTTVTAAAAATATHAYAAARPSTSAAAVATLATAAAADAADATTAVANAADSTTVVADAANATTADTDAAAAAADATDATSPAAASADATNATPAAAADATDATPAAADATPATYAANAASAVTDAAPAAAPDGGHRNGAAVHAGPQSGSADDAREDCAAGARQHAWGRLPILKHLLSAGHQMTKGFTLALMVEMFPGVTFN
ncbi:hypothetical protein PVAP13_6NG036855 [Panicum virgatum]|uniref:Mediator of RNA polymerase II transcription subunit 25 n=1 Tax=Panicum virgatum TaxID=38727 RepID=A0A8T0QSH9_PANVG|nr:hypothetical protein PVAP13_6NG036855 [Panicum virgatum]